MKLISIDRVEEDPTDARWQNFKFLTIVRQLRHKVFGFVTRPGMDEAQRAKPLGEFARVLSSRTDVMARQGRRISIKRPWRSLEAIKLVYCSKIDHTS